MPLTKGCKGAARKHTAREVDDRVNVTQPWQFGRVVELLKRCEAMKFVHQAFEQRAGAKRVLPADAFLAAALLTPMLGLDMHMTMLLATIRGWTPEQRAVVGFDPDAQISYKMVTGAFEKLRTACDESSDPRWDAGTVAQDFLTTSVCFEPPPTAVAIDGTDICTWASMSNANPIVDAHPDAPPPPDSSAAPPDPTNPHAKVRGRHRPPAPIGPDGRWIYSGDPDARIGWRSPKFGQTMYFLGYEAHVVTDAPGPDGVPVPRVVRSLHLVPAGSHRGAAGLIALERIGGVPAPCEILCDRAYNYTRAETFALPLISKGHTLIVDLHTSQYGTHPGPIPGTMWIDGTLYSTCLPAGLIESLPITLCMSDEERERAQEQRRLRKPWAFVPHGPRRPDGSRRYRGPGVAGSVRSPLVPKSMRKGYDVPTARCDRLGPGKECGCAKTVTLHDEDYPNIRMPFQHGSAEWFASYYRREHIESLFGDLKFNRLHERRGFFRIFGLTAHRLLVGFTLTAMNLMMLREWYRQRGQVDGSGQLIGEQPPQIPARLCRAPRLRHRPAATKIRATTHTKRARAKR